MVIAHSSARRPVRRIGAALLTALASATFVGVDASSAAAADYPYPNAPDCDEYGPSGCVPDAWNFYQGQCTSHVAWRLNARNGVPFNNSYGGVRWGDATNWDNAARAAGIRVDGTPGVGAVAQYERGHVAYVEAVNSNGSVTLSEMNFDRHNGRRTFTVAPGVSRGSVGGWPDVFIHLRDVASAPSSPSAPSSSFPVGASRIVDDPAISGPTSWLTRKSGSAGHASDYMVTQSAGGRPYTTNQATWVFSSLPAGTYRIEAFVPHADAVATVTYKAFDGPAQELVRSLNQQASYGFTSLGNVSVGNGRLLVHQADDWSPASQYGRLIGWDAMRIVRIF